MLAPLWKKILCGGKVVGSRQPGTALKDVSICGKQTLAHTEVCTYTAAIHLLLPLFFHNSFTDT